MSSAEGPSVEDSRRRRRRGVGFGEGVSPPNRAGVWGGGSAAPHNFFLILCLGMVHFSSILTRLGSSQGLLQ